MHVCYGVVGGLVLCGIALSHVLTTTRHNFISCHDSMYPLVTPHDCITQFLTLTTSIITIIKSYY